MGGRGSSSGLTAKAPTTPQSISECEDMAALAKYMSDTHYVYINAKTLAQQEFEVIKRSASAMEAVIREFPQAAANFHELRGEDLKMGTMAYATFNGIITTGNQYFRSQSVLDSKYSLGVSKGIHPAGTTGDNVVSHEAGHILERAMIDKYVLSKGGGLTTQLEAHKAWNKGTYASKIVSEACRVAKKTPEGKGLKSDALISSVSGYAKSNRSETLAECVADYMANRGNAKPLSRAVWSILKRELG